MVEVECYLLISGTSKLRRLTKYGAAMSPPFSILSTNTANALGTIPIGGMLAEALQAGDDRATPVLFLTCLSLSGVSLSNCNWTA